MNSLSRRHCVACVVVLVASWGQSGAVAAPDAAPRFTGILTLRQQDGDLYYKVFVVRGKVIGGWQRFRGSERPDHDIVGGWYLPPRLAILVQSVRDDVEDKWFSHYHQFQKNSQGLFILRYSLHGFGSTVESGGVFQPHVHDEASEMSEEAVRQRLKEATQKPGEQAPDSAESQPEQQPAPPQESK